MGAFNMGVFNIRVKPYRGDPFKQGRGHMGNVWASFSELFNSSGPNNMNNTQAFSDKLCSLVKK